MKTDQLIHALTQDLSTPAPTPGKRMKVLVPTVSLALLGVWLALVGARADIMTSGFQPTVIKTILGSLLLVCATHAALILSRPGIPSRDALRILALIPLCAATVMTAEWLTLGSNNWQGRLFGKDIVPCLIGIPLLAVLPLIATLQALRAGAPSQPGLCGGVAGLMAGGIAIVIYGLFCTENSALFIGTWYLAASLMTAAIGAVLGRSFLRW